MDVIHTNAGGIGTETSMGHVDFYVSDGIKQPACFNFWILLNCKKLYDVFKKFEEAWGLTSDVTRAGHTGHLPGGAKSIRTGCCQRKIKGVL